MKASYDSLFSILRSLKVNSENLTGALGRLCSLSGIHLITVGEQRLCDIFVSNEQHDLPRCVQNHAELTGTKTDYILDRLRFTGKEQCMQH